MIPRKTTIESSTPCSVLPGGLFAFVYTAWDLTRANPELAVGNDRSFDSGTSIDRAVASLVDEDEIVAFSLRRACTNKHSGPIGLDTYAIENHLTAVITQSDETPRNVFLREAFEDRNVRTGLTTAELVHPGESGKILSPVAFLAPETPGPVRGRQPPIIGQVIKARGATEVYVALDSLTEVVRSRRPNVTEVKTVPTH